MKENIIKTPIENVFAQRFGRYSKYIIQERALPDVRDGLKPVQRRILYAMYKDNNTFDKQFRKSAKTVGNVIGNYHPHGDSSVYEAMVRMSQQWKVNEQLVVMHGNNGSIDGDNPAAMRYTEAKLSEYSNFMLQDILLETVKMVPNFDDTELEPSILPARIPNLLINGTSGIASGYATDIPPHNMIEVIKAAIHINESKDVSVSDIMKYIKGPDFPTGGVIKGDSGIKDAYKTGRGQIKIEAKYEIIKNDIIISEIPYEVNKSTLLHKIELLKLNKKVEGINEIIDQSDQNGLEIKISCVKGIDTQMVMNFLLKNTDLQKNFNFNMIAIANKKPKLMGIVEILKEFIHHREETVIRRTKFLLEKNKRRLEVVSGLIVAIEDLDLVIKLIRKSSDKQNAKDNLMKELKLSDVQAEAVVSMQLYRLTNTDIKKLEDEHLELEVQIGSLTKILDSKVELKKVITDELKELLEKNKSKRKTQINEKFEEIILDQNDLIKEEKNILVITKQKYIKRTSLRSYLTAKANPQLMKEDQIHIIQEISNKDILAIFFDDGSYALVPAYSVEENKWRDMGKNLSQLIKTSGSNKVIEVKVYKKEAQVISISKKGYILKFDMEQLYTKKISTKVKYQKLKPGDNIQSVCIVDKQKDILFITDVGKYQVISNIDIESNNIKLVGKKINGINKKEEMQAVLPLENNIIGFSRNGYYIYIKSESLLKNTYRFDILYTSLKTEVIKMQNYLVNIDKEILIINQSDYKELKLSELTKIVPGDKVKKITSIKEVDIISRPI